MINGQNRRKYTKCTWLFDVICVGVGIVITLSMVETPCGHYWRTVGAHHSWLVLFTSNSSRDRTNNDTPTDGVDKG